MTLDRTRRIAPADPGGEPVCLLTAEGARERLVPIDRLLEHGELRSLDSGYEIRLPPGDASWELANLFAEEEARCCAALALEVAERQDAIVVTAWF